MLRTSCTSGGGLEACRDDAAALKLKMIAIASILLAGVAGVAIPLIGKHRRFLRTDGSLFVAAKAFAAGVILATGFVHMLSAGSDALSDPCLPEYPWKKFPFSGFFAMMAALFTLLVDFLGTQYYERKQGLVNRAGEESGRVGSVETGHGGIEPVLDDKNAPNGLVFGEEEGGGMHIVGMRAHAAHHSHSHPHGQDACHGNVKDREHEHGHGHGHEHGHGHDHGFGDEESGVRHVVVSQVSLFVSY